MSTGLNEQMQGFRKNINKKLVSCRQMNSYTGQRQRQKEHKCDIRIIIYQMGENNMKKVKKNRKVTEIKVAC